MRKRTGYVGTRVEVKPETRVKMLELIGTGIATEFIESTLSLGIAEISYETPSRGEVSKVRSSVWIETTQALMTRAKNAAKLSGRSFSDWFRTALELRIARESIVV